MKLLKKLFFGLFYLGIGISFLIFAGLFIVLIVLFSRGLSQEDLTSLRVKTEHAVGVVELVGEIISSEKFERSLKQYIDSEKIKAIVVRIDSPGGAVGASEEIYRLIKEANEVKPVVCSLGSVAASGGLFAAVGCKKIVANESTLTGSIGVIMMVPNLHEILDKFGFHMNVVKSGKFKDTGSPFREFSQEDRDLMESLINKAYEQFVRVISESRGLDVDKVKSFADGRVIIGEQAKEFGLIDEFGGLLRAAKLALELAGDNAEPEVIMPMRAVSVMSLLREMPDTRLFRWMELWGRSRLMYLSFV